MEKLFQSESNSDGNGSEIQSHSSYINEVIIEEIQIMDEN